MRKCPFCAEEIQDGAIKCRWCNEFLVEKPAVQAKWYNKTTTILAGFLVLGPFVLPLVWTNPRYSQQKKIIVSALIIAATILMVYAAGAMMKQMQDQYKMLF